MWLEIEGGVLINLELVDKIEPTHHKKTATAWIGGIVQAESRILYQYFETHRLAQTPEVFAKMPEKPKEK